MLHEIYKALSVGHSVSTQELAKSLGVTQEMIVAGLDNLEHADLIERVTLETRCKSGSCNGCSCSGGCSVPNLVMWRAKRVSKVEEAV